MTNSDFMTEEREVHGGNVAQGTICEEMYLHEKPHTEVKIFDLQTAASEETYKSSKAVPDQKGVEGGTKL